MQTFKIFTFYIFHSSCSFHCDEPAGQGHYFFSAHHSDLSLSLHQKSDRQSQLYGLHWPILLDVMAISLHLYCSHSTIALCWCQVKNFNEFCRNFSLAIRDEIEIFFGLHLKFLFSPLLLLLNVGLLFSYLFYLLIHHYHSAIGNRQLWILKSPWDPLFLLSSIK